WLPRVWRAAAGNPARPSLGSDRSASLPPMWRSSRLQPYADGLRQISGEYLKRGGVHTPAGADALGKIPFCTVYIHGHLGRFFPRPLRQTVYGPPSVIGSSASRRQRDIAASAAYHTLWRPHG